MHCILFFIWHLYKSHIAKSSSRQEPEANLQAAEANRLKIDDIKAASEQLSQKLEDAEKHSRTLQREKAALQHRLEIKEV
jgi:hypothetical protein